MPTTSTWDSKTQDVTSSSPGTVYLNNPAGGYLVLNDTDYFQVTLTAGVTYNMSLDGFGSDYLVDPLLTISSANGTTVAYSDDRDHSNLNSSLIYRPTTTGTYRITVATASHGDYGDYRLMVRQDPAKYLNGLIDDEYYRWNSSDPLGTTVATTFSFMTTLPTAYADQSEAKNFLAMNNDQKTAARQALALYSEVANITFQEVADSNQIRFGTTSMSDTVGWAYPPDTNMPDQPGDVWITNSAEDHLHPTVVHDSYQTFIHEIGHALGLNHPFETARPLTGSQENIRYTNMSYTYPNNSTYWEQSGQSDSSSQLWQVAPTGLMLYDIATIQYLYGANTTTRTGNDIYSWASDQVFFQTIWDAGGTDTISAANQTLPNIIDLRAGNFSSIGIRATPGTGAPSDLASSITYNGKNNLAIAFNVTIENAVGGSGNDQLIGNSDNNTLDGGAGADNMQGGVGNDTYIVASVGDLVTENANGGIDTVQAWISYTLRANVENLTLISGDLGTGNALANTLTGNSGNNILNGGAGADTLIGGTGDDIYIVDNSGDTVTENADAGTDTIQSSISYTLAANVENLTITGSANRNGTGNTMANILLGNSGNNILDGGGGADTLQGNAGNDTYLVDNSGDLVIENAKAGADTVQASISYLLADNVENLILTGSAPLNGTGNTLGNALTGNNGNNILDGGAGADTLRGGTGDDTYIVDRAGDLVIESAGAGTDTVQAPINYTLTANVDNLTLTGTDNLNGTGNALANTLTGNNGNNILNGGGGADTLLGLGNDDTYIVDNVGDTVIENADGGTDLVNASVSFALSANVENLTLTGRGNCNGTGNTLANILIGNVGNNILDGGAGADTLRGGAGNDTYLVDNAGDTVIENARSGTDTIQSSISCTLSANVENLTLTGSAAITGVGNDLANILIGNNGDNTLTGGGGADLFKFVTANGGVDTITDFVAGIDKIQVVATNFGFTVGARVTLRLGTNLPTGTRAQFLYDASNGQLCFDRDGTGMEYATVQLATLGSDHRRFIAGDIQVVAT